MTTRSPFSAACFFGASVQRLFALASCSSCSSTAPSSSSTVSRSSARPSICGGGTSGSASSLDRDLGVLARLILLIELDLAAGAPGARSAPGAAAGRRPGPRPASASRRSASPCIFRMRFGGTLPGRKPGMRTCGASRLTSCSTRASISSAGMVSMKARFRPSFSVSTVLITCLKFPMKSMMRRSRYRARNGARGGTRTPTSCDTGPKPAASTNSATRARPRRCAAYNRHGRFGQPARAGNRCAARRVHLRGERHLMQQLPPFPDDPPQHAGAVASLASRASRRPKLRPSRPTSTFRRPRHRGTDPPATPISPVG